jgi:hypothetical protein
MWDLGRTLTTILSVASGEELVCRQASVSRCGRRVSLWLAAAGGAQSLRNGYSVLRNREPKGTAFSKVVFTVMTASLTAETQPLQSIPGLQSRVPKWCPGAQASLPTVFSVFDELTPHKSEARGIGCKPGYLGPLKPRLSCAPLITYFSLHCPAKEDRTGDDNACPCHQSDDF